MGEMQSKTPEQIAKGLSPAMRTVLMTGAKLEGGARVHGHTNTIVALIDRGLVLGGRAVDHRWTALGREVARHAGGAYGASAIKTMDELHQQAIDEDMKRFPPKPDPAPATNLLPGDPVALATTPGSIWEVVERYVGEDGTPWLKLGLLESKSGPMIGQYVSSPASAARLWTDRPARPRIVDEIINRGPVLPMDVGEIRVRSAADFNALRDYLMRNPAQPPDAERVIRRAQYEALRAVAVAAARDPLLAGVTLNIVSRVAAALGVPTRVAEGLPGDA